MAKLPKIFGIVLAILLGFASLQLLRLVENPSRPPAGEPPAATGSLLETP